ncbi:adenylate cyclase [Psychromonas ingrahamii 37]|uniref:Adenylate cyclase n=1 Tax=Psychromonas ingrahamii (strain DSM 17664 / CCUG 51855 / 37) TaxID=357804 RepID=A1SW13_PSYIN|nr:CYTH domain-containing protein [Psychromonas ingrahamii]ABM03678.1 adenylate cyclase [Psychromonas ingrahamii 37]
MAKEIERKFLLDLTKLGSLDSGTLIRQGYITTIDKTVVRTRLAGDRAYLTLKGKNKGVTRTEFEYEIPVNDAQEIISELCNGPVVEKTRYLIVYSGHTWEVDIFHGDNDGLVVAEIELESEQETFELPHWITTEVSGDPKYYNSSLLDNPFKHWK